LPDLSNAMPLGLQSEDCVTVALEHVPFTDGPVANVVWPITSEALIPVENGDLNSRILLFVPSTTQRSPEESKAISRGPLKLLCVGAGAGVPAMESERVKFGQPITRDAFMPLVSVGSLCALIMVMKELENKNKREIAKTKNSLWER